MPQRPPKEGVKHTIQPGEWTGSVAIAYGFADWNSDVWRHAENRDLREKREDPHILCAGDCLFIPPWEDREAEAATEQKHTFKLKTPTETFRLRVLDAAGQPLANIQYVIELDYDPCGGVFVQKNTATDGDGVLEEVIPSTARAARVRIPDANLNLQIDLGRLLPLDHDDEKVRLAAAQQRLIALGYYSGEADGRDDAATAIALSLFQQFCIDNPDLPGVKDPGEADGRLSEETAAALRSFYGC